MGLNIVIMKDEEDYIINEDMGSYSRYHRWRKSIAESKGFDLDKMKGYEGNEPWESKPFPLILNHSDCDGEYSLDQIPELLKEVTEIKKLNIDDYQQSDKFIRLCKKSLKYKKPIVFQ